MTQRYAYTDPRGAGMTHVFSVEPFNQGDAAHCPQCGACISLLPWLPPHVAEIEALRHKLDDVIRYGNEIIVSERFRQQYEGEGLTGLVGWYPLKVKRVVYKCQPPKVKGEFPVYWVTTAARSEVHLDDAASNTVRYPAPPCSLCHRGGLRAIDRVVLADDRIPSTDVSEIHGFSGHIVSQRFRDSCITNKMSGMHFIPLPEYRYRELE